MSRKIPRGVTKNVRRALAKGKTKVDLAEEIFNKYEGKLERKEMIDKFISRAGLTPSGANTYYQRFASGQTGKKGTRTRGRPVDPTSKAGRARVLFDRMHNKPRKDVIAAFKSKLGLSDAGSSTYYQKIKTSQAAAQ